MKDRILERLNRLISAMVGAVIRSPERRETAEQFMRFAIIGVANTCIDFGIYYLLTRHTSFFSAERPTRYLANVISFCTATTWSFFANRTWTFGRTDRPTFGEAARFYATTISGLAINSGVLYVCSQVFAVNDLVSKVFSTVFSTVWNFAFKKLWVFVPETEKEAAV